MMVAGENDHKLVDVVVHLFDEAVNCFLPKGVGLVVHQRVGFINEEGSSESLLDDGLDFDCGLP